MARKPRVVKIPAAEEPWRDNLRKSALKVGFGLHLSKAMLEYLCAVADDVYWDRGLYWHQNIIPDNWIASENSLIRRGLIQRKTREEIDANKNKNWETWEEACEFGHCKLTPAGECIVQILKLAGMFVEQDAAINKKAKARRA